LPGFALRFSDFKKPLTLDAPFLGEHNELVHTRDLGYRPSQVRELEHSGVLHSGSR
ncbi:MAG: hypothetical protein QOK03_3384, partial [Candidatus Binataceae bacterium]|nr:hypothetical protein [Candidatus Binataceae bacterium]